MPKAPPEWLAGHWNRQHVCREDPAHNPIHPSPVPLESNAWENIHHFESLLLEDRISPDALLKAHGEVSGFDTAFARSRARHDGSPDFPALLSTIFQYYLPPRENE